MEKQLALNFDDAERRSVLELWRVDELYEEASEELLRKLYEDNRLERKPPGIHAEPLSEYVCMWANTAPEGGLLVVGVNDDGEIIGCKDRAEELIAVERRIRNDLVPDARFDSKRVQVTNARGQTDFVLLFWTQFSDDKLIETNKGKAFIRRVDTNHELTDAEKRELQIERGQRSFELEPCGLSWPNDFDQNAISAWIAGVRKTKGIKDRDENESAHQVLSRHRLGKVQRGKFVPNNACALLFANDPRAVVPGCIIKFQRIDGTVLKTGADRNVVKTIEITGTIPKVIVSAFETVNAQLRTFEKKASDGKFYTVSEYPDEAWHETIVNACVHRSYSLRGANIFIRMFDDRFEVESPGGFPALVTEQTIYDLHYRRNWWLMDAMLFLKFVLCEAEGAKRIRRAMVESGLPEPRWEQKQIGGAVVRVTLKNGFPLRQLWVDSDVSRIIGPERASRCNEFEKRVINFIAEHGKIQTTQAMNFLPKPRWGTAFAKLKKMVKDGLLVHNKRAERDSKGNYTLKPTKPTRPTATQK